MAVHLLNFQLSFDYPSICRHHCSSCQLDNITNHDFLYVDFLYLILSPDIAKLILLFILINFGQIDILPQLNNKNQPKIDSKQAQPNQSLKIGDRQLIITKEHSQNQQNQRETKPRQHTCILCKWFNNNIKQYIFIWRLNLISTKPTNSLFNWILRNTLKWWCL